MKTLMEFLNLLLYWFNIHTTSLFYVLTPACFGSSLPSSGSLLDPPELLEIQIVRVVYHITCGYVTCVSECRGSGTEHVM
jgi:hypothetical protein